MGSDEESFALPAEGSGLVRRECAECHRTFEVRAGELDASTVQRAMARRLAHANDCELGELPPERFCPYCGHTAPEDAWLTAQQRAAVEKRADHWLREVRYVQLMQPRQTLADNPNVTYLAVPPEPFAEQALRSAEVLQAFPLVCCREQIRISPGWQGPVRCYFCGVEHEIPRMVPGFLERIGSGGLDL